ncbi:MAG TPA: hypothetical protein VFH95_15100 [Candidatus Kapabacteria bacterium]|nr:hypothetical protein [Candidatus Kapabacteria bacterium]
MKPRLLARNCVLLLFSLSGCLGQEAPNSGPFYYTSFTYTADYLVDSIGVFRHATASVQDNTKPYLPPELSITLNSLPLQFTTSDSMYSADSILPQSDGSLDWEMKSVPNLQLPQASFNIKLPMLTTHILYPNDSAVLPRGGPITINWLADSGANHVLIQIFDDAGNASYEWSAQNTGSITLPRSEDLDWLSPGPATVCLWRVNAIDTSYSNMNLHAYAYARTFAHFTLR